MWIWDGTDREEFDGEAAFADVLRRALISRDPLLTAEMKSYVAAFSIVLTNRKGSALAAPEPLIQGGFTPSDDERRRMCETVRRDGRDLVHICFRTVPPVMPTGLIVVVYLDSDTVRLHSRTSLTWVAQDQSIRLYGVEDGPDLNCHFEFPAGAKIIRRDGFPTAAESPELKRASARVEDLIARGAIGDTSNERLTFYHERAYVDDEVPL